jgi:hypothetical protein
MSGRKNSDDRVGFVPNRETHGALWAHIDKVAAEVEQWPYWKRGGSFAEAEDRARAAATEQERIEKEALQASFHAFDPVI